MFRVSTYCYYQYRKDQNTKQPKRSKKESHQIRCFPSKEIVNDQLVSTLKTVPKIHLMNFQQQLLNRLKLLLNFHAILLSI